MVFHWHHTKGSYYAKHTLKDIQAMTVVVCLNNTTEFKIKPGRIHQGYGPHRARRWNIHLEMVNETDEPWNIISYKLVEPESEYHFTVLPHTVLPGETLKSLLRLVTVPYDKTEEATCQDRYQYQSRV